MAVNYFKRNWNAYNKGISKLQKQYSKGEIDYNTLLQETGRLSNRYISEDAKREAAKKSMEASYKTAANAKKTDAAVADVNYKLKQGISNTVKQLNPFAKNKNTATNNKNTATNNENTAQRASTNVGRIASSIQGVSAPYSTYIPRSGIDPTGMSTAKRNQAAIHAQQASDEQKNAQANAQIANRDYRNEAGKNAAASAAIRSAQKMDTLPAATDLATAAVQREIGSPDYNTMMNRQDVQRKEGVTNQREMYGAQNVAADERGTANKWDYDARQRNIINSLTSGLSNGGYGQGEENKGATQPQQSVTPTQENPVPVDEVTAVTGENTVNIDGKTYDNVDLQNAMNELEMRTDPGITKRYVYSVTDNNISVNSDVYRSDVNNRKSRAEWLAKYLWEKYNGSIDAIRAYNGKIRSVWTNGHSNYENDTDRATAAAKDTTTQA